MKAHLHLYSRAWQSHKVLCTSIKLWQLQVIWDGKWVFWACMVEGKGYEALHALVWFPHACMHGGKRTKPYMCCKAPLTMPASNNHQSMEHIFSGMLGAISDRVWHNSIHIIFWWLIYNATNWATVIGILTSNLYFLTIWAMFNVEFEWEMEIFEDK